MTHSINIQIANIRANLAEYGKDSTVFQPWNTIPTSLKTTTNGRRMTITQNSKNTTVATPWHGPKALHLLHT